MTVKVAIACDHAGFKLKEFLKSKFEEAPVEWIDLGTDSENSVNYPEFGFALADVVASGKAEYGIAICGSGNGMSMAANRRPEIRAAVCTSETMARLAREHNNANVLCLGERLTGTEVALDIVHRFLTTDFEGGRHRGRVEALGKVPQAV